MGKRIIINGADFSQNGIKSYNYVSGIYTTANAQKFEFEPNFDFMGAKGIYTVEFKCINQYNYGMLFILHYTASDPTSFNVISNGSFNLGIWLYRFTNTDPQALIPLTVGQNYILRLDVANKKATLNGVEYDIPYTGGGITYHYLQLLGGNNKEFAIKNFKYEEVEGTPLLDMAAILDDNNIPCFHDFVSNTNIYNVDPTNNPPQYIE